MPDPRYQVPGIPPGPMAAGITAFMPHFNRLAASGAQSYKYGIQGGPGLFHPAPTTDTAPSPDQGDRAQMGTSRSSDCPDGWWIDDYNLTGNREELPGAGMPIAVYNPVFPGRTTLLPVPAEDLRTRYQVDSARLSRVAILNRIRQLPWFPRGLTIKDTNVNA